MVALTSRAIANYRSVVPLRAVLSASFLTLVGCGHKHTITVEPPHLPDVIRRLDRIASGEHLVLVSNGVRAEIQRSHDPELTVRASPGPAGSCPVRRAWMGQPLNGKCDLEVSSATQDVQVAGKDLLVRESPTETAELALRDIKSAQITLNNWDPPGWRQTWGVGATIGATGGFGLRGDVLPAKWLALEFGTVPIKDFAVFFTGFRVRPIETNGMRPYVGAFASVAYICGSAEECEGSSGAGPRLGVDIEAGTYWLVGLEASLVRNLQSGHKFYGIAGNWIPWGGVALTYFY